MQLPERVLSLANAVLDDHSSDPALARAAALLFAASATVGSDAWCLTLQKGLCAELAGSVREGRDAGRRGAVALALGCLHRFRGGMAMQVGGEEEGRGEMRGLEEGWGGWRCR